MKKSIILLAVYFVVVLTKNAHAYLDPGTGSYMLQILLGTLAAGFFGIKHYWKRISGFFASKSKEDNLDD